MPKKPANNRKKIPMNRILKHFCSLPEKERVALLRKYIDQKTINELGGSLFGEILTELRSKPEAEARAFLTNDANFGGPWRDMFQYAENYTTKMTDGIYGRAGARTDEDKIYALIMSDTLPNRIGGLYQAVKDEKKPFYEDNMLAKFNTVDKLSFYLNNPIYFAPGKDLQGFLEDVQATMDLSKEKSTMEQFREGIPATDPMRKEKLRRAAELSMILPEGVMDPGEISEKLRSPDWKKTTKPLDALREAYKDDKVKLPQLADQIEAALRDVPETEEDKRLFQDAALQLCRNVKRVFRKDKLEDPDGEAFRKLSGTVLAEVAKRELAAEPVQKLRQELAKEHAVLAKKKSGFLLTTTDTREYKEMMKGLRLFNAKLEMLEGKTPEGLTEEELKTVKNTDADVLLENAKHGCYNYGRLKTKDGVKGIIHTAGIDRFNSSMKTISHLNELGKKLHLIEPAEALRDEVQREFLQNRRNKSWLAENAETLAAKAVYAQDLLKKGTAVSRQERSLEGAALEAKLEKVKAHPTFRRMMQDNSPEKLADAMIKGVTGLAELYGKASEAESAEAGKRTAPEVGPKDLQHKEPTTSPKSIGKF